MVHLKLSLMILFKPVDAFYAVKQYREKINSGYTLLLYLLAFLAQYVYISIVHYPMNNMRPVETNIILEFVKLILPVLVWVVASYGITTILDGESKISDIFHSSALCMVPFIILKPLLGVVSNLMSQEEAGLFNLLKAAIIIWMVSLLFLGLLKMNDYTLSKAIGITIISIIAMLIICAVGLLIYALSSQLVLFFSDIAREIGMSD